MLILTLQVLTRSLKSFGLKNMSFLIEQQNSYITSQPPFHGCLRGHIQKQLSALVKQVGPIFHSEEK